MIPDNHKLSLFTRLRQYPSTYTVPGSLPVLFFGDAFLAKIATVGLNPSDKEYLDKNGLELTGSERRLETLGSLAATSRNDLTEGQCERAIETMRTYYRPGKPVYAWFRPLDRVTEAMGCNYETGGVAHLDLVQEATTPTWSRLRKVDRAEFDVLRSTNLPFLQWEIENFRFETIICNGRTPFNTVCGLVNGKVTQTGRVARLEWFVAEAELSGRKVCLLGWNLPLTRPTGLDASGESDFGRLLFAKCH